MNQNKTYAGIDFFRFAAAFLVIAIHTSPFTTYSEMGDFIFTRIICRIAVPFFLITSGFFLISNYAYNNEKLEIFVKKTALIYGISIVLYLPLNVYRHDFAVDYLFPNIIKDLVFDGTIYHLWYLPASILGAVTAWFLVRKTGFQTVFLITLLLYILGLLGDSYYGIIEEIPFLQNFYHHIFEISDYTRNGIFYAPIFFVMGGMIAQKKKEISPGKLIFGFCFSILLMLCEGILLHQLGIQRHDCMYLFLIPCTYFLFHLLLLWKGKRHELLRTSALIIYILHPLVIVGVRLLAKTISMQNLFIKNSLVHYIVVSAITALLSIPLSILLDQIKGRHPKSSDLIQDRAWIELNFQHLKNNIQVLSKAMPENCELMAVVKAEAYGHGAYEIAVYANQLGVQAFAVATIDEGIRLRRYGITGLILILGYTNPARAKELHQFKLSQTILDYDYAISLNRQGYHINAHIKIDTGMHRLGFCPEEIEKLSDVFNMKHLKISGIFTHLCVSDSKDKQDIAFTKLQIKKFYDLLEKLKARHFAVPKIHIQSSYGFLNYPELKCDYIRIGIALYGILSSPNQQTNVHLDLRPVLSLKSKIILIRNIMAGESVGYGRDFIAHQDSTIAILPIGYADGIPRNLSQKSYVLINHCKAPIIGKICMDQLAVDVTKIPNVKVGQIATLIGKDGDKEITAPDIAESLDSISNELLSCMGRRLKIIIK